MKNVEKTKRAMVVVKIGGVFLQKESRLRLFFSELALLQRNYDFVLVHGGGNKISAYSKGYGINARFNTQGLRLTSSAEMLHADRILAGEINTHLVRTACTYGIEAVGLSAVDGALVEAEAIEAHTGRVKSCKVRVLQTLTRGNYLPVVCPVAATHGGMALNVNADDLANAIACAWPAEHLLSISDVERIIIRGQEKHGISDAEVRDYIKSGDIHGGMVPKTQNALQCLEAGVKTVIVGTLVSEGDLHALLQSTKGTRIFQA